MSWELNAILFEPYTLRFTSFRQRFSVLHTDNAAKNTGLEVGGQVFPSIFGMVDSFKKSQIEMTS